MTIEAIEKIKAAENEAAELVANARKKASELRANAENDSAAAQKAAHDRAALIVRTAEEEAKKKADGIVEKGVASARSDAKKLVFDAALNTDDAAEEIIRGIFAKWQ